MGTQLSFIDHPSGKPFDAIKHVDERGEYWLARELQIPLGYVKWQKFQIAIERAQTSCRNSGHDPRDHFTGSGKPIITGKGRQQVIFDLRLTRYACYLVAMNGDPRKPEISEAQTYFAIKTHLQEIHEAEPTSPAIAALEAAVLALKEHERRIASLEAWQQECRTQGDTPLSLPAQTVDTPEKPIRAAINQIVRSAAHRRGCPQSYLWNGLYRELKYRKSFDALTRAEHSDKSAIDEVEAAGLLPTLYAIARETMEPIDAIQGVLQ